MVIKSLNSNLSHRVEFVQSDPESVSIMSNGIKIGSIQLKSTFDETNTLYSMVVFSQGSNLYQQENLDVECN